MPSGFDPKFDDACWNTRALDLPVAQVKAGHYPGGYEVRRKALRTIRVFDNAYRALTPLDCRALHTPDGALWMSDVPQERMMMANNAERAHGRVLIGGLGLALFPQYFPQTVTHVTVVEHSPIVFDIAGDVFQAAIAARGLAAKIVIADIDEFLTSDDSTYDTIFLDTWENLDPLNLPHINRLRDAAATKLTTGGRVLAWGYRWITRLFEAACEPLVSTLPEQRIAWLEALRALNVRAFPLLSEASEFIQDATDVADARRRCQEFAECVTVPMTVHKQK